MTAADRPSVTPRVEPWPDGTRVRFTDAARQAMREPKHLGPLRTPKGGPDGTFTVENTDDTLHDVILVETGERWGALWLEEAPGEQPRPSVTDNARAEQRSEYTVQETAAYFARKVQRVSDRLHLPDYRRSALDAVVLDSVQAFLDRIARDDLDVFAAGRAETTTEHRQACHDGNRDPDCAECYPTATDEDAQTGTFEAILAAHRDEYDSDCGMYFGCSCGWDNDDIGSNEGYVEHVAGLLATARTCPTRTIYSVQAWEDADGIRASWVTGYGQYTHSRSDAEATLKHQERQHPDTTFRLAQAEVTPWTEADQ